MARLTTIIVVLGVLGTIAMRAPSWHLARAPGGGCWPPRCDEAQVPLATPVIAHGTRLIMIGDGAAPTTGYESLDGTQWQAFEHDAAWGARYQASDASFRGAIWRVGGFVQQGADRPLANDVWRSEDGRRWTRVLEHAPWPPRARAHLVVFRDSLWLIGGEPHDDRIWSTIDGTTWTSRNASMLPRANPQGVLVFRDSLWILAHGEWDAAKNDVWSSADGRNWNRVSDATPWTRRTGAGFGVVDGRMWVVAGVGQRDAWWSADGRSWRRLDGEIPGPPRGADYTAVFQDAMWVIGGKTGGAGGTGFWDGIVYLK
jgi:hypothetical protein